MARRAFQFGFVGLAALSAAVATAADDPVGRPKQFVQGKGKAYGVWYEDGVWKLRTTSKDAGRQTVRVVFTGTVTVDGDRLSGDFSGLEKAKKAVDADWVRLAKNNTVLEFRFATFGATDGVDFKIGPKAKSVTFTLKSGGDDDPRIIYIGAGGTHPEKSTFTLPAHPNR